MGQAKLRKQLLGAEYGKFVQRQPAEPQYKSMCFDVEFGQVKNLKQWLTLEQLKQCEADLLFHQEPIKLAKLLSDRGNVVLDFSAVDAKGSAA